MSKQQIQTHLAPQAIGTYSQAIQCGNTIYISGQIPLLPGATTIINEDIELQTHQVFDNIQAITTAAGGSLVDIVKLTVYLTDLNNFAVVNQIMTNYFNEPYPARAVVGVTALPKHAKIEIDSIMVLT